MTVLRASMSHLPMCLAILSSIRRIVSAKAPRSTYGGSASRRYQHTSCSDDTLSDILRSRRLHCRTLPLGRHRVLSHLERLLPKHHQELCSCKVSSTSRLTHFSKELLTAFIQLAGSSNPYTRCSPHSFLVYSCRLRTLPLPSPHTKTPNRVVRHAHSWTTPL